MPRDPSAAKTRPAAAAPPALSRINSSASAAPSAHEMDSLSVLLTEQGLAEYEQEIRGKGITEPHHLLRLTPAVIEAIIVDKPIHQRKLAALSRGRNLNAATFSMDSANPNAKKGAKGPGGAAAPFRSKSADDVLPEKPGLRSEAATAMPDLAKPLQHAVDAKFGDDFTATVTKFLVLQGVVEAEDLKHCDTVVLMEQVKDAGAKPIQLGKLKDWVQSTTSGALPPAPPPAEDAASEGGEKKKNRPPPKRSESKLGGLFGSSGNSGRSSSANDVVEEPLAEDTMQESLTKRFGRFYDDPLQSFLMTQGVLNEDDLMVRDHVKMLATAKVVGVKPVQLSKLKDWMLELQDLGGDGKAGGGAQRPQLPHERQGSKLKLSKQPSQSAGKDYDAASRAARASKDVGAADMGL